MYIPTSCYRNPNVSPYASSSRKRTRLRDQMTCVRLPITSLAQEVFEQIPCLVTLRLSSLIWQMKLKIVPTNFKGLLRRWNEFTYMNALYNYQVMYTFKSLPKIGFALKVAQVSLLLQKSYYALPCACIRHRCRNVNQISDLAAGVGLNLRESKDETGLWAPARSHCAVLWLGWELQRNTIPLDFAPLWLPNEYIQTAAAGLC